jgi:hypothetical protein
VTIRPSNAGVGDADTQHDEEGEPPRHTRFGSDRSNQQRSEQEPRGVIGKAAERYIEACNFQRPEQKAADQPSHRILYRLGDPGDDHECGDREPVLGRRLEIDRREPDRQWEDDAERLSQGGDPRISGFRWLQVRMDGCQELLSGVMSRHNISRDGMRMKGDLQRWRPALTTMVS